MKPLARVYTILDHPSCNASTHWLMAVLMIVVIPAGNACAQDKPIVPSPHPQFRERVSTGEYSTRFASAAAVLKDASLQSRTLRPAVGLTIKMVHEGSPADRLGIRTGDLAARMNGVALWSTSSFGADARRSLEFFSVASQKLKTVKLPQGVVGIGTIEFWHPEWIYLRGKSSKPEWDAEAVVGITTASSDPDLAETAWRRAVEKGYKPDSYSAAAGLEIALARGDSQLAAECVGYLRRFEAENADIVHPVLLYRAALANGQLQEMLRVTDKYPNVIPVEAAEIQQLIDLQAQQPQHEYPHTLAAKFLRDDQVPRLLGYCSNDLEFSLPTLQRKETLTLTASPGHWDALIVSPPEPTPNVDISMKITWEPELVNEEEYHPNIDISLVDNRSPRFGFEGNGNSQPVLMALSITQSSSGLTESGAQGLETRARLQHFLAKQAFQYVDRGLKWGPQTKYDIRLLKIGGQGELFVDGHPLIAIPIDASIHEVALRVTISGSKAVIHEFHFDELVEDATK